jgi:hypothetical protein
MTTLLDFATTDLARVNGDKTSAQSAVSAAQTGLAAAQQDRDDNARAIGNKQDDIARKRIEIANAAMPADAAAAAAELETMLIELNDLQAHAVDVQVQIDTYQSQIDVQLDILGNATTRSVQATSALSAAQKTDAGHAAWHASIGVAPLATISADATTALGSQAYTDAKARAQDGFDATLLAHVRKRESNEQTRLALIESTLQDMEDDLDAKIEADRGLAGAVAPLQRTYDRAAADFRALATGAQDRYNRALGLITTIATAPALTDAERNRMLDATIVNAAKSNPVTHEEAVETAEDALTEAQIGLDRAQAQTDVGLTPFDTVANQTTAFNTATGDVGTAQGAFVSADEDALDKWEVTVPDSSWSLLAAFDEATLILNDLKTNATPTKLAAAEKAMTDAATALVTTGLDPLAQSEHDIALLSERAKQQSELLDAAERNGSARVLNAMRGDG